MALIVLDHILDQDELLLCNELESSNIIIRNQINSCFFQSFTNKLAIHATFNGVQEYSLEGKIFKLEKNLFLIFNPKQRYSLKIDSREKTNSLYILINKEFFNEALKYIEENESLLIDNQNTYKKLPLFVNKIYEQDCLMKNLLLNFRNTTFTSNNYTNQARDELHRLIRKLILIHKSTVLEIKRVSAVKSSTQKELYNSILLAKEYIDLNYRKLLTINEIADIVSLSSFHFLRTFKEILGETPHKYMNSKRLEYSRTLLIQTSIPVTQICFDSGFESLPSFSLKFNKYTGLTPKEYRNRYSIKSNFR